MEVEHVDAPCGGHEPNEPAHVSGKRTQLPEVQPEHETKTRLTFDACTKNNRGISLGCYAMTLFFDEVILYLFWF